MGKNHDSLLVKNMPGVADVARATKGNTADRYEGFQREGALQAGTKNSALARYRKRQSAFSEAVLAAIVTVHVVSCPGGCRQKQCFMGFL